MKLGIVYETKGWWVDWFVRNIPAWVVNNAEKRWQSRIKAVKKYIWERSMWIIEIVNLD
jgi:hypothetical protein